MGKSADKSALFMAYWELLAPDDAKREVLWTPEHQFAEPRRWRFDFAAIDQRIACEVDGGSFASRGGRHATDSDRDKLNQAAAMGWRVFRFSPQMLTDNPHRCVSQVLQALGYAPLTED